MPHWIGCDKLEVNYLNGQSNAEKLNKNLFVLLYSITIRLLSVTLIHHIPHTPKFVPDI